MQMFLPRSGTSTMERSAISGSGARHLRTDPRPKPSRARARAAWQPEGQRAVQCPCRGPVRARRSAAHAEGVGRDVCAPTRGRGELELELIQPLMAQKPVLRGEVGCACVAREVRGQLGRGPKALQRRGSLHSFGCTTSGHCLGRRGREARAATAGCDVFAPTRGRGQVGRGPKALRQWGSPHSFGCTTSGHRLGRRGREA